MEERLPKGALGGQAVIEGVMMKGPNSYSVAVRKPDQKIEVTLQKHQAFGDKHKICKIPFLRGVVNFAESMVIGMKTLTYSSSFYDDEEEETKADRIFKDIFKEKAENVIIGFTVMLSIIIAVALFMLLPAGLAEIISKWVENHYLLACIEGVIRLIIFFIYVVLISQMEDIKRVFMYHGAEHKTINCYESGEDLTPENVAKHTRYHKRCGTSFLFIVMIVSIFVFMFITADQMWLRLLLRVVLIPVVAGISYEFIRLAGRNDNAFFNILSKPGMWVQKLTTKEPSEEMIQVAIISVEAVIYGKPYVKAVNEAQGIGVKAEEEEDTVDDEITADIEEAVELEEMIEESIPQGDSVSEFDNLILGEELEENYDEKTSLEEYDKFETYEDEDVEEEEETVTVETVEIEEDLLTETKAPVKQENISKESVATTSKEKIEDTIAKDFDLSEFEKSFFED